MSVEELNDERTTAPPRVGTTRVARVIRLDDPNHAPDPALLDGSDSVMRKRLAALWNRIPARRAVVAAVLTAFVAGLGLGFGTKKEWDEVRAESARSDVVDVGITLGRVHAYSGASIIELAVTNKGPLPISVVDASTEAAAVFVRGRELPQEIASGSQENVQIEYDVDCALLKFDAPMDLSLTVRPDNGRDRPVAMDTSGGAMIWGGFMPPDCEQGQEIGARYVGLGIQEPAPEPGNRAASTVTVLLEVNTDGARRAQDLRRVEVPWGGSVRTSEPPLPVELPPDSVILLELVLTLPSCREAEFVSIGSDLSFVAVPSGGSENRTGFDYGYTPLGAAFQRDVLDRMTALCPEELARAG